MPKMNIESELKKSRNEYLMLRGLADWALRRKNDELAVRLYSATANYAEYIHSGFFVDPVIENRLLKIGLRTLACKASDECDVRISSNKVISILHVVSEIVDIGGLCRTLINWINNDPDTTHTIVTLRQRDRGGMPWFHEQIRGRSIRVIELDHTLGMLQRAMELRTISQQGDYTACIMHVGQAEAIPTLAFARPEGPATMFVDHADHSFWLGIATTDVVIHQRPVGAHLCEARRSARQCHILPIPLMPTPEQLEVIPLTEQQISERRALARDSLGVGENQIMGLTVGRQEKYQPTHNDNFFREAIRLAHKHPQMILHVVGVEKSQAESWVGERFPDDQFYFYGEVSVRHELRLAADFYLESYPFGSQTAFLEAAQSGIPGVRAHVDTPLLATSETAVDSLIEVPANENEYWQHVEKLIEDTDNRQHIARQLKEQVQAAHTGLTWRNSLNELYKLVLSVKHSPGELDETSEDIFDTHDLALHQWSRWHLNTWSGDYVLRLHVKSLINDAMRRQIHNRQFRLLPSLALRALFLGCADRTILAMGLQSLFRLRMTSFD